eukprot:CAMPEP_0170096644 /NCGR_PEP_ID=MMETSP0019_2-20121128/28724_1 /TAXON_ID=98059 /ORGANISM="Dinobryon sp., Strain UTEXLB2267" /LENGTH=893 /DNA_ID=CAMNT_0010318705 /DNA_START=36 /DNA_END=2717 /DNA_ORIENTATION=+
MSSTGSISSTSNYRASIGGMQSSLNTKMDLSQQYGRQSTGGINVGMMSTMSENMSLGSAVIPNSNSAPNGMSGAARRLSSTARKSLSTPRGSTIGTTLLPPSQPVSSLSQSQLSTVRIVDPRNFGDKQFMTNSIRSLVDFLIQHNFSNEFPSTSVSPKVLAKPTNKDFQNIVLFLFKQIDSNFKCTGKFEDEMITMFKFLGYPFQIAKSSISAVGSPHAWPSLLAAIMWLVELLQYDSAVLQNRNSVLQSSVDGPFSLGENGFADLDDPSVSEKAFYRYLSKAYELFLAGKDDQYVKLEEQFVASFENKNVLIRDQIEAFEQRNNSLTQEIEAVKGRSAYLPELEAKKKEFHAEYQKFKYLLDELKKHRDQLKSKVDARSAELDKLRASHTQATREIAVLRERVATQELSAADVANMVSERQRLEEAQVAASENRQGLQRRIYELEMALRDKVQYLEDSVRAYHSIAGELYLVPLSARNSRGEDLTIEIDIGAKKREGLIKTDIRHGVLPVLQDLKNELVQTTLSLRAELLAERDIADEIDCKRSELVGAQEMMEAKLKRAEAAYKREKDLLDQGSELHRQELDAMETRLLQLRDTASEEAALTASNRRLAEQKEARAARRQEHERTKNAMIEAVTEAVSRCANHREKVQRTLAELKGQYAGRLSHFLHDGQPSADHQSIAHHILNEPSQPSLRSYVQPTTNSSTPLTQDSLASTNERSRYQQHNQQPQLSRQQHQAQQPMPQQEDSNGYSSSLPVPPGPFPVHPPLPPSLPANHSSYSSTTAAPATAMTTRAAAQPHTEERDIFRLAQDTDSMAFEGDNDLSDSMMSSAQFSQSFLSEQLPYQHHSHRGTQAQPLTQVPNYSSLNPRRALDFTAYVSAAASSAGDGSNSHFA